MPNELFFKLSEKKRTKIIKSGLLEFSKAKFHDASINQIVKMANISRGSFYQYFADKEDLYFHIIERSIVSTKQSVQRCFEAQPLDIFTVYRELLKVNLLVISDEQYGPFFKNLYQSMNYQLQERMKLMVRQQRNDFLTDDIKSIIEESGYDQQYFIELVNILELINRDLLTLKIAKDFSDIDILTIYDLRMKVFRQPPHDNK